MASDNALRALSCWNLRSAATVTDGPSPIPGGTPVNELVMPCTIGTRSGLPELVCRFAVIRWQTRPEPVLSGGVSADSGFDLAGCSCACLLYTSPSPRDGLLSRMP